MIEPHLEEAPFVEFCGDIVIDNGAPSIGHTDPICSELFESTPTSSPLLSTTPSHVHAFYESLGDIRGYDLSFDPYSTYLEDVPRKIVWNTYFHHASNFFYGI